MNKIQNITFMEQIFKNFEFIPQEDLDNESIKLEPPKFTYKYSDKYLLMAIEYKDLQSKIDLVSAVGDLLVDLYDSDKEKFELVKNNLVGMHDRKETIFEGINAGLNDGEIQLHAGINDGFNAGINAGVNDGEIQLHAGINDGLHRLSIGLNDEILNAEIHGVPGINAGINDGIQLNAGVNAGIQLNAGGLPGLSAGIPGLSAEVEDITYRSGQINTGNSFEVEIRDLTNEIHTDKPRDFTIELRSNIESIKESNERNI